jgi:hypothetical protein
MTRVRARCWHGGHRWPLLPRPATVRNITMRATAITIGTATAILLSALSGCSATGVTPGAHHPPTTAKPKIAQALSRPVNGRITPGYPSSMAVLGHSNATGEDSDPAQPHAVIRANSWATGTNPAVNSVYLRILAQNPAIKGHNFNLAQPGATVGELLVEARQAVALKPTPELFLVQIMDNDIVCPATSRDYATFRSKLITALGVLAHGAPQSRIFVVSQWGSPTTYWKALHPAQRQQFGGAGPCAFLDPHGRLVPKELVRLETIIHGYEAQLAAGCKRIPRCTYDGGAFGRQVDKNEQISEDLNHFTVKGAAEAAAAAWVAMRRRGVIP